MVHDGGTELLSALDSPADVLLLTSTHDPEDRDLCFDLLTIEDPADENVWSLGITLSPDKRVENWQRHVGRPQRTFAS